MTLREIIAGVQLIPEANPLISVSERVYNHDMIQVVTFDHNLKFHIIYIFFFFFFLSR